MTAAPHRAHSPDFSHAGPRPRRGVTLVEAVMATLILGLVIAAVLEVNALSSRVLRHADQRQIAQELAAALLEEIMLYPYDAPPAAPGTFADVDDFDGWVTEPPELPDGTVLTDFPDYERSVEVDLMNANNPAATSGTDQGLKRITVTVSYQGRKLAVVSALRSDHD